MKSMLIFILAFTSLAIAQQPPTDFPEGSIPLTAEELKSAVADKVFTAQPVSGTAWRLQYNRSGYFFVNVGSFSDSGKWSTKDSTLCTEGRQVKYFCNEFRIKDGTLYMKRENGEVLQMVLK